MITVLRAAGINHIIAVDGNEDRLKVAQKMGAKTTICFRRPDEDTLDKRVAKIKAIANNVGVDFAYQCTGAPVAAADIYSYIRRGGGMCEMENKIGISASPSKVPRSLIDQKLSV